MSENIIKILPDFIANQIAAGEVVQRPESVVKELVENSLDAGADSIAVIVRDAGKQLIHIVDNGSGMTKIDLELSVKRHATSKIISSEDLEKINSFGFRGEALASISSVAQLEIRTRMDNDEIGWQLFAEPMKEPVLTPFHSTKGTQVFVKNLFYNVPARRKFLRSNLTEFRHIADTMLKFAISHFEKRFTFYDGENLIFDVKPSDLKQRIIQLLGSQLSDNLFEIEHKNDTVSINGFVALPEYSKLSRTGQFLFLNKRSIQSRTLAHAVISSFEHVTDKSRQPVFIVNIDIDSSKVDVNVHPQKHEVKFEDERIIYGTIHKAVARALQENGIVPKIKFDESIAMSPFETKKISFNGNEDTVLVNKVTGEIIERNIVPQSPSSNFSNYHQAYKIQQNNDKFDIANLNLIFDKSNFHTTNSNLINEVQSENSTRHESLSKENEKIISNSKFLFTGNLWQVHNKYIFAQTESGILIIDQHAAHERVLYEKALKMMNREMKQSQNLLFPVCKQFTPSQIQLIIDLQNDLLSLGFNFQIKDNELEFFGIPLDVKHGKEDRSLLEMIEVFEDYEKFRPTSRRDNLAATYACKNAIKTGDQLSYEEIVSLLNNLFHCEMPYSCPHGRPVILEFNLEDFDKQFKRT